MRGPVKSDLPKAAIANISQTNNSGPGTENVSLLAFGKERCVYEISRVLLFLMTALISVGVRNATAVYKFSLRNRLNSLSSTLSGSNRPRMPVRQNSGFQRLKPEPVTG